MSAAPKCKQCGHSPCPGCVDWCDEILHVDGDVEICCDGECKWDWPMPEVREWCEARKKGSGPSDLFESPPEVVLENGKMMKIISDLFKRRGS